MFMSVDAQPSNIAGVAMTADTSSLCRAAVRALNTVDPLDKVSSRICCGA